MVEEVEEKGRKRRERERKRDLISPLKASFVSCLLRDLNGSGVVLRHGRGLFFENTPSFTLVYGGFLCFSTIATNL